MVIAWLFLVGFSAWVALLTFFWALQDGQFSDQERARFLPLSGEEEAPVGKRQAWKGKERYFFVCMGAALLIVFGMALYISVRAVPTTG